MTQFDSVNSCEMMVSRLAMHEGYEVLKTILSIVYLMTWYIKQEAYKLWEHIKICIFTETVVLLRYEINLVIRYDAYRAQHSITLPLYNCDFLWK